MRKLSKLIIFVVIGFLCICCYNHYKNINLQPKEVVEKYYYSYNSHKSNKLRSTLTSTLNNGRFEFDNSNIMKILSIEEDLKLKSDYIKYGRGAVNNIDEDNIVAFRVTYVEVDRVSKNESNKLTKEFYLIKESDNSGWLIDDIGE